MNETSTRQESAPSAGRASPATRRKPWAAVAGATAVAAAKGKAALGLLKFATMGKFALTALSMLAMVWFEAQRQGWLFGAGFVLLILVHELGHGWAIKRSGLQAGWPVFIPFFGAMISMRGQIRDRGVEAEIAYAGPVAGTAASLLVAALGLSLHSRLFLALAYTGFFLNLFNLVPIPPLDGGRVATAFSRRAWIVGAILLGGIFLVTAAPQALLIALLAFTHMRRRPTDVPELDAEQQSAWATKYFGLCFFLGAAVFLTQRLLHAA